MKFHWGENGCPNCKNCQTPLIEEFTNDFLNSYLKYDETFTAEDDQLLSIDYLCLQCFYSLLQTELDSFYYEKMDYIGKSDISETAKNLAVDDQLKHFNLQMKILADLRKKYPFALPEKIVLDKHMPSPILVKLAKKNDSSQNNTLQFPEPPQSYGPPLNAKAGSIGAKVMAIQQQLQRLKKEDEQ